MSTCNQLDLETVGSLTDYAHKSPDTEKNSLLGMLASAVERFEASNSIVAGLKNEIPLFIISPKFWVRLSCLAECLERILGIIDWNPSVSKSNWLHVDFVCFLFNINLR